MAAPVTDRYHIDGSRHIRPEAHRVIYADGAGATAVRPGRDIDLSHWVPNRTEARYKADTSTEICLRYSADPSHADVELVVNDHVDIDGILALYAIVHADVALEHHDTLVGAAAMGDFHAWADRPAFELNQELARLLSSDARPADRGDAYAAAFRTVTAVLDGSAARSDEVAAAWDVVERGCDRLERGEVTTEVAGDRLVSFVLPPAATADLGAALRIPAMNECVDESVWLWPQSRNRRWGEWVQLVSVPVDGGWFHDVWAPSYCWAETPDRAPLPGLVSTGDSNVWRIEHPPLTDAVEALAGAETSPGRWVSADQLTPFETLAGRRFPVLVSCVDAAGRPSPSGLAPDTVAAALATVW